MKYSLQLLLKFSVFFFHGSCYYNLVSAFSSSTASSIGQRIQQATQTADLLRVAQDLWLPTDEDLPVHLWTQRVHHEKRLRWSAQLLGKLGATANRGDDDFLWGNKKDLERAVLAAAIPFDEDRPDKEGRYLNEALVGLHNIMGYTEKATNVPLSATLQQGLSQLVQRADKLAWQLPLAQVAEIRWACRGILARCKDLELLVDEIDDLTNMNARVAALPFDITPSVLDWNDVFPGQDAVDRLQGEIPFHFDTIVTRTGTAVTERRGTAWIAEDGIGALAYSGKLMPPQPITDPVRSIMRLVESRLDNTEIIDQIPFFDCALCNHYPDGESACKFHTDPEHGSHWERLNCVVAAGSPRRFAFRPIPDHSSWSEWENSDQQMKCDQDDKRVQDDQDSTPAVITLFPGDVAQMWGTCNDDFYHAVYPGHTRPGGERQAVGRISLVLKKAISRHGGVRGHSLAGQGRRSRRQQNQQEASATTTVASAASTRPGSKRRRSKPRRR